jgi:hypothetical protein
MSAAILRAEPSIAMPPASTEDTIIEARPQRAALPFLDDETEARTAQSGNPLERCRALFRELGERMSSFDLSRQIYG